MKIFIHFLNRIEHWPADVGVLFGTGEAEWFGDSTPAVIKNDVTECFLYIEAARNAAYFGSGLAGARFPGGAPAFMSAFAVAIRGKADIA